MIDRLRRSSIRLQFIAVALFTIPVIIVCIIALLPEPLIFYNEKMLTAKRAQMELIVNQLRSAGNDSDLERLVSSTAPLGIELKVLPWSALNGGRERQGDVPVISDELRSVLPDDLEAITLEDTPGSEKVAVRLDAMRALVVGFSSAYSSPSFFSLILEFIVKVSILMLPMLLLVLYMGYMITSPLIRFAEAAKGLRLDDSEEESFAAEGAQEIRTLATSLNNMRSRIRKMVDDRTRMLMAVSHDLRTPLTRLRMRVERLRDAESREAMLADVATLTAMIEDSLQYLSSTATTELSRKVDISSLLQTIASEFGDLGHVVSYSGPDRLVYLCRQKALVRAITNIVENAVKFGTVVSLELRGDGRGGAVIVVNDNGPGLEDGLHDKALEPFFKADTARGSSANGGFGLGLSIADEIVRGHGGSLSLANLSPHGLRVTMELPRQTIAAASAADPGDKAPAGNGRALEQNAIVLKN